MKITSFNPLIITKDSDTVVKLFEEIGFERKHKKTGISDKDITSTIMENPEGFHVDIAKAEVPKDMTTIRMNVDDFDEAYNMLTEHGFVAVNGGKITDTGSSKAVMLVSPTGFSISVVKHIKKKD